MTTLLRLAAALLLLVPAVASAQWEAHPDKRIPRKADGTPDLEAPAPRAADGKPDLSGVWQGFGTLGGTAAQQEPEGTVPRAGVANVGQNMKEPLPLRPEYKTLADERRAAGGKDNPEATCLPMGIMQFHTQGAPRKFIQTPDVLVILYEASMGIRQIFTDGREFPSNDPQPWWYGYSVGHWEGDTLVVETKNFNDQTWLTDNGAFHTDDLRVVERLRRTADTLEWTATAHDPAQGRLQNWSFPRTSETYAPARYPGSDPSRSMPSGRLVVPACPSRSAVRLHRGLQTQDHEAWFWPSHFLMNDASMETNCRSNPP